MFFITVQVLFKLFVKLGTALLIGPAEKCPMSSVTFYSETVMGFG